MCFTLLIYFLKNLQAHNIKINHIMVQKQTKIKIKKQIENTYYFVTWPPKSVFYEIYTALERKLLHRFHQTLNNHITYNYSLSISWAM